MVAGKPPSPCCDDCKEAFGVSAHGTDRKFCAMEDFGIGATRAPGKPDRGSVLIGRGTRSESFSLGATGIAPQPALGTAAISCDGG